MRIVGPNCLGVMSPTTGLNATFATTIARRGSVGFISQSGALCTAILDWSKQENVGFSHFVSVGSNDLMQFFFASDRGNPRLGQRYDLLSPPTQAPVTSCGL